MDTQPLTEGFYYHIYNRGINGEDIFKEEKNYIYFLQQYHFYCSTVFDTIAYALLKNHFHLLVRVVESPTEIKRNGEGIVQLKASKQLSHFFNSYTQAINKAYKRTGGLFETPFKRKKIDNDFYITSMILYCHFNPQSHDFVDDFKKWKFTSYHSIVNNDNSQLNTSQTLDWFGGINGFMKAHQIRLDAINVTSIKDFLLE